MQSITTPSTFETHIALQLPPGMPTLHASASNTVKRRTFTFCQLRVLSYYILGVAVMVLGARHEFVCNLCIYIVVIFQTHRYTHEVRCLSPKNRLTPVRWLGSRTLLDGLESWGQNVPLGWPMSISIREEVVAPTIRAQSTPGCIEGEGMGRL